MQDVPRRFEREGRSVLAPVAALHSMRMLGVGDDLLVDALQLGAARGQYVLRTHLQQFFPGVAEHAARGAVHIHELHRRPIDQDDHVRGVVHRDAESAVLLFRLLALQELSDLAADHVYRAQQPLVRLADLSAGAAEHAHDLAFGGDREHERSVHAGVARELRLRDARVLGDVRGPQGLARPPHLAGQADPGSVGEIARPGDETLDGLAGDAPCLGEAQDARFFVRRKVPAALPVLRLADGPHGRLQRRGGAGCFREAARDRVLEYEQLLVAAALGDVARHTAIAAEAALLVENGLPARADEPEPDLRIRALVDELAERFPCLQDRLVFFPAAAVAYGE